MTKNFHELRTKEISMMREEAVNGMKRFTLIMNILFWMLISLGFLLCLTLIGIPIAIACFFLAAIIKLWVIKKIIPQELEKALLRLEVEEAQLNQN